MAKRPKGSKGKGSGKSKGYGQGDQIEPTQAEDEHIGHVILVWGEKVYFIPADRVGPAVEGVDAAEIQGAIASKAGGNRIEYARRIGKVEQVKASANN